MSNFLFVFNFNLSFSVKIFFDLPIVPRDMNSRSAIGYVMNQVGSEGIEEKIRNYWNDFELERIKW